MAVRRPLALLVEDEAVVRHLLTLCLRGAGYRVLEAGNRAEAVRCCHSPEPISLLVCDATLSGDAGGLVAQVLAVLQPGMRVLFTSGLPQGAAVEAGLVPPGCHFLQKPFRPEALYAKLAEVLHGPAAAG